MSSPAPPVGPVVETDDEVRGWTSRVGTDTEFEPVTESEAKARDTLANSIGKIAASTVEEESAGSPGGSSENNEHESIGLETRKYKDPSHILHY